MRYLRMLHNSLLGAALAAAYLVVLFLQLNPAVPLTPSGVGSLFVLLALSYGVHFAGVFYALIVLRQLLASEVSSPGWVSFSLLAWLSAASATAVAALMWLNVHWFSPVLRPDTVRRMATGAAGLSMCAVVFLLLALVHYSFGRRGSRVGASLFALTLVASLSLPLVARGPGTPEALGARTLEARPVRPASAAAPRVIAILLDGASLDFISTAVTAGRLPNFAKVIEGGASMHVATQRPTQPGPVWAAVATGKLPVKNGVRSAARYETWQGAVSLDLLPDSCFSHALVRFGFLAERLHTSTVWRARPIWEILSGAGMPVGVVGWPLTHPVKPVRGYIASDRLHLMGVDALDQDEVPVVYPRELLAAVRAAAEPTRSAEPVTAPYASTGLSMLLPDARGIHPFADDALYERVSAAMLAAHDVRFAAVRYHGLDTVGHSYLRYAMPHAFGDVTDEERRRFGEVLIAAYGAIDEVVGRALTGLRQDDLLLVVSGFGMSPLSVGKRLLERAIGTPYLNGSHEDGPDGFLLAYGGAVEPGRRPAAALVDVAPTILYYLGLPVGRDMDGYARTDIFRPEMIRDRPITFIPSHDR